VVDPPKSDIVNIVVANSPSQPKDASLTALIAA